MMELQNCHRKATVVVTHNERVLGALAPVQLSEPWFQEIRELVEIVRERDGQDIAILRLLEVDDQHPPEIKVSYLAEVGTDALDPGLLFNWDGELDAQPLRLPYAKPGGPEEILHWAASTLMELGHGEVSRKTQIRTWNLSSIWRLDTAQETFWVKTVPAFFAHEAEVLTLLAGEPVPVLWAAENRSMLLKHLPGEDCYNASIEQMLCMVETLVNLQWRWKDDLGRLTEAGVPIATSSVLCESISAVYQQYREQFAGEIRDVLDIFVNGLPERLQALDACGLPTTIVHGDFHPGNWRGEGLDLTILDWGDCFIGHPLFDMPALIERAESNGDLVREHWCVTWQSLVPDAAVSEALDLVRPVAEARRAVVYQDFLDNIEPSERIYHDTDPVLALQRTAELLSNVRLDL